MELTIEIDGDRLVEEEVARQTQARLQRFADDSDRDLGYAPETRVRVSH